MGHHQQYTCSCQRNPDHTPPVQAFIQNQPAQGRHEDRRGCDDPVSDRGLRSDQAGFLLVMDTPR